MVANGLLNIAVELYIPDPFRNHGVGNHTVGIHNQQGEYVKLFRRQTDFMATNTYRPAFQAEIQVSHTAFCQLLR